MFNLLNFAYSTSPKSEANAAGIWHE